MRFRWRQFVTLLFLMWAFSCAAAIESTAQTPAPTAPRSLNEILAMESATERVNALQQFLKANPSGENTTSAREALVASHAQLGETQLGENNIEKAFESFQRAIRALPKQVSDRFFEETVIKIPMAVSTRGYRAEAVLLGKTMEMRFASEAERLAAIGEFYLTIEASGEAINALENAAQLTPEDGRLQRALGAAYRMGLRIDDAVAAYQLAVRYDPKDRRAYYDLANLYRSQGAYEDALKLYRKQLEIDPKHSASYKGLALAYTALGKDDQATAALNQVRDLRGSSDEITQDILLQTQLAFYLLGQGKVKAARQAAEAALLVEPRFSWARIAAAEVEMADRKFFEAERHLLAAQQFANFPTLAFTLGKLYLIVEDFDGAAEHLSKAFSYSNADKFTTRLGGVRDVQADELKDLLAPEHQAAIFLAEPPTSDELFKIAESLTRTNAKLLEAKPRAPAINEKAREKGKDEPKPDANSDKLEQAVTGFVEAEASRRAFRALYMSRRLAQAGKSLPLAIKLADQALDLAESATETDGALPDLPNFDREGRLRTFRGRALDTRGWALFKGGQNATAVAALSEAITAFGPLPEHKEALRHLATAKETAGELPLALEMHLAAYEPATDKNRTDLNRAAIEVLYRKVNGSLNGLTERLGQPLSAKTAELIANTARLANPPKAQPPATTMAATETGKNSEANPSATSEFNPNQLLVQRSNETGTKNNPRPLNNAAAASGKPTQPATEPGAQEPLRVGLLGIPINANTPRNTPPQFSKPAPRAGSGNAPTTPAKTPAAAPGEQVIEIAKELPKPPPVVEKVEKIEKAAESPAPTTRPTTETKPDVAQVTPETEKPAATLPAPPESTTSAKEKPVELPATQADATVAVSLAAPPLNVTTPKTPTEPEPERPAPPKASAPTVEVVEKVELPQLPALDEGRLAAIPLVSAFVPAADWWRVTFPLTETTTKQPPPPALTAETGVTVRYEVLPNNKAAATPTELPPLSTRPRRVNELVPVPPPMPNTRRRRVTGPAAKP